MAILKPQIKEKILKNAKRQHPTKHLDQKDTKTKKSKLSGGLFFTFSWGVKSPLFPPVRYSTATNTLTYWLNKNNHCLKVVVTVDKHQRFKSFIRQMTSTRLEHLSSKPEKSFVSNFKIADYFFWLQVTFICKMLRSEILSGICAKLHTVAASNNRVHMPWSLSTYTGCHVQSFTS